MKKLILIYDHELSDADIQCAKDLLKIKSLRPLTGEVINALTVLISRSFPQLKNADVSLYTMRDCILRPALFMSPWAPWMTIAPTKQQRNEMLRLGSCVREASIALSYFEEARKISYDFSANFKRITGDYTYVQKGLDFINLDQMVRFDIAKLKEPTRQLIESAKY